MAIRAFSYSRVFVADARSVGMLEMAGLSFDTEKNRGVDPWTLTRDSDLAVFWKSSNGIGLRASPKRVFEFLTSRTV
jgi:hypothetical protein